MSNIKISQLPNLGTLANGTQFPVANNNGSYSVTASTIQTFVVGAGFTSSGNITAGNISATNHTGTTVNVTGNVTGSYILGNGSQLTGIDATSIQSGTSNVRVISSGGNVTTSIGGTPNVVVVSTGGANITGYVTASGNVTGSYILGNGSQLTGIDATSIQNGTSAVSVISSGGNIRANVAGATVQTLSTGGANVTGYITASGNVTGGNLITSGAGGSITGAGNITGGNLISNGAVTATGNVTGSYILGNGSQLTGIDATSIQNGTANVRTFNNGNVTVSAAGTANVLVVTSTGANIAGTLNTGTGNANVGNIGATNGVFSGALTGITTLNASGNANVGNLGATNVDATNVAGTLTTAAQTNITSVGTLTSLAVTGNVSSGNVSGTTGTFTNVIGGNITIGADLISSLGTTITIDPAASGNTGLVVIQGNLQVNGTTTTINSNVVSTNDLTVNYANNAINSAAANGGGIEVGPIGSPYITWLYNNTSNLFASSAGISAVGNISGGNVSGTAGTFTNVIGTLQTAAQTNITSVGTLGSLAVTGNITSGNLSGTSIVGTLTTAAQTNITSVGTLGSLSVTGNVSAGNLSGTNVTGTLATASQPNITSVGTLGTLSVTGNANVGNLGATSIVGTLTTAAQTNITSVGTLTSLAVTGNVSGGNILGGANVNATTHTGATVNVTGNISGGNLSVSTGTITGGNIVNGNGNGVGNIGSSTVYFNTVFAKATSAQYADLAEKYTADAEYAPGTVLAFGGSAEVTLSTEPGSTRVAGVVSTNPSYIMNAGLTGEHVVLVALQGRVPCRVVGPVTKGDMMVAATNGAAQVDNSARAGTIIGKALENFDGAQGTIEIVVGRN